MRICSISIIGSISNSTVAYDPWLRAAMVLPMLKADHAFTLPIGNNRLPKVIFPIFTEFCEVYMALKIVDNECRIEGGKLVVVVEGANPEEVLSSKAKQMALEKAAACGYQRVGLNGQTGSYPIDADGKTYDDNEWNTVAMAGKIAGYRNEIKLMSGI